MSVQRRVNWISQQRVDVPDMRAVESAASNDFDGLIKSFVTGTSQGYILRGFEMSMSGAIGGAASGLQLITDPGAVFHVTSSQSGTFYLVPTGQPLQQLNSATNTTVDGAFVPSAINYVGLEYERFIDDTTSSQVYIWDPTTNNETTKNAPRAQILRYRIKITTSVFAANVLPIATITTDAGNNVVSITDARWMLFRLATGGASPNPFYVYPWTAQSEGRVENPSTSTSNSVNPFHGGDKMLMTLKDWMNAIMSALQEIKGTTYWYSVNSAGSIESLREDLGNTITTGAGSISHGILPNATPVLSTTGDITSGSNQLTNLASTTGIVPGQFVIASNGILTGTTVLSISGSTVTLSSNAATTTVGVGVSFFDPSVMTAPGQVNWDKDIFLNVIGSQISYKFTANPSSADVTLADDQVAYVTLVRDVLIGPNLVFTNSSAVVQSVGLVAWTASLLAGDFVKLGSDTVSGYYKIQSVDSLSQVTLTLPYAGTSTGASGAKAKYAFGSYSVAASPSTNRDMFIADRADVPQGQDVWWFLLREDNGGVVPRVYVRFIGQELEQGDSKAIDDGVSLQLLQYIGSPSESSSRPNYSSALNPGSVAEITDFKVGSAATITSGQYFFVNSSGDSRKYYVWFKKDGTGVDPAPAANRTGIQVNVTTGQTAINVATALASAFGTTFFPDFTAIQRNTPNNDTVRVTNRSAGTATNASNFNVGAPFTVTIIQQGTGTGNFAINDGDNLTLAIKELDEAMAAFAAALDSPSYDENVDIVASGATPPTSLNGPISPGTNITLPNNSRLSNIPQKYTVGKGTLEIFLNGQYLRLGIDWTEVGSSGVASSQIQIQQTLVVGDELEFRISSGGGGGSGGGIGPQGPPGLTGPPGADAAGGPIAISTKTSDYTIMLSDCMLKADCSTGSVMFTLPSAASAIGRIFYLKKIDSTANAMIIQAFGAELLDGFNNQNTTIQYESFSVISDGTTWSIF